MASWAQGVEKWNKERGWNDVRDERPAVSVQFWKWFGYDLENGLWQKALNHWLSNCDLETITIWNYLKTECIRDSICHIVQSVTDSIKENLRKLSDTGLCVMAYDNLDFDFKTKEPRNVLSITMATFIPLTVPMVPHLMTSNTWKNFGRRMLSIPIIPGTQDWPPYLIDHTSLITFKSDWVMYYKDWNGLWERYLLIIIWTVQGETWKHTFLIYPQPTGKTVQYPACAMHLKASVNDDNITIVKTLEWQIGTSLEYKNTV